LAAPASAAPEPEVAAPPTAPSPDPIAPPPPPVLSFEEAERRLLNPTERDDVGRALLEFGVGHARRAILFRIHRDEVAGWMAAGEGLDTDSLLAYRGALDRPSVFFTLHRGAPLIRGPLSDLPAHEPLRAALAGQTAIDALALPITVRDRLVAVLYLEPRGTAFAPTEVAGLQRLTAKAAIAFELCIMRSKLRRA
jgi:GAF domain-containing protein